MKKNLILFFLIIILSQNNNLKAQEKILFSDIQTKITENTEVKIAKQDEIRTTYSIKEARANYLPNINFQGSFNHNIKPLVFFLPANFLDPNAPTGVFNAIPASAQNAYQGGFNITIPLLQMENKPILNIAKNQNYIAQLNTKHKIQQKIAEVRKLYLQAVFLIAQQQFIKENIQRQQQNLAEIRQKLKEGFAIQVDTLMAFVQCQNLKPQLLKAQNAYKLAENNLKLQLNIPQEQNIILENDVFNPQNDTKNNNVNNDNANLFLNNFLKVSSNNFNNINADLSPENRPDLLQIKAQKQGLLLAKKAERNRLMPNLQAIGQFNAITQSENFEFNKYHWVNTAMVGLQLNIPIFEGWRTKNRLAQMEIQASQTQMQYDYALAQSKLEINTYQIQSAEIIEQLKTQDFVVKSAQMSYQLMADRWKQGLIKQNELYDAEIALQQAKLNLLELQYQFSVLQVELQSKLGMKN
jgi:outer membrane protein